MKSSSIPIALHLLLLLTTFSSSIQSIPFNYNPSALITSLATSHSLNHIIAFPSPPTPLSSSATLSYLQSNYNLYNNKLSGGNISACSYVSDPFVSSSISSLEPTVLSVNYPPGSYSGNSLGGLQFFSEVLNGSQTVMLNYQVGFPKEFNFNKGGKLPGLFGGNTTGECSGGRNSDNCFSARLMFRTGGAGEVYAYVPVYPGFCNNSTVDCNVEYGTSLSRGSFSFIPGTWTNITMIISLNTYPQANGLLQFYANGQQVMNYTNIVWRIDNTVTFSALMFSTFFGGSDSSWASTGSTSYFKNFDLYASNFTSTSTGAVVTAVNQPGLAGSTTTASGASSTNTSKATSGGENLLHPTGLLFSTTVFFTLFALL